MNLPSSQPSYNCYYAFTQKYFQIYIWSDKSIFLA